MIQTHRTWFVLKMATSMISQKRARDVNYKLLNSFSSEVLFDTAPKPKKSRLYEVERVITRRRIRYVSSVDKFLLFDMYCVRHYKHLSRIWICECWVLLIRWFLYSLFILFQDNQYLIKWKGWSLDCSSWEPAGNLTQDLLRFVSGINSKLFSQFRHASWWI